MKRTTVLEYYGSRRVISKAWTRCRDPCHDRLQDPGHQVTCINFLPRGRLGGLVPPLSTTLTRYIRTLILGLSFDPSPPHEGTSGLHVVDWSSDILHIQHTVDHR